MDFAPDADQQAVVDAVCTIFDREAGPERARALGMSGHDDALLATLETQGFLDVFHDDTLGPLGAALIAAAASRRNAKVNVAVRTLVAAAMLGPAAPLRVAVTHRSNRGPVRYGQHADVVLILDGDEALVAEVSSASPVASPYGYAYAWIETGNERSLGDGSGRRLADWWRVAIAVEISGALDGAMAHTVEHLSQRSQFGKPLGALQALQHRLAEAHVWTEGAKWLALRAAASGAASEEATVAAAYAAEAAQVVGTDMHQLSGAIGFTTEFDLSLWTTRLHALRMEAGGPTGHQLATTSAHWG